MDVINIRLNFGVINFFTNRFAKKYFRTVSKLMLKNNWL